MNLQFLNSIPYLCDRWAALVQQAPEALFLLDESTGRELTRHQADEISARVYGWLAHRGIGTEDFVQILLPRGPEPFLAMLGVWKAGAAFTVTEDTYAPERIAAIRQDCGCRAVIDTAAWQEILDTAPLDGFRRAADHDACFAIYTSGSTGRPKGVLQEYGKIRLNQASLERHPGDLISEETIMAVLAPLNFIAAVKIFLNALYSGMQLIVFAMDTARNPVRMNEQFIRYGVNLAFLSPSLLRVMASGVAPCLKTLVTGSESANGVWFEGIRLINNYGMSEAGFHVAQFEIDRRYDITPIGKPLREEILIRLLDEQGREVPEGSAGEICFENPFFRGYIGLPEETERVLRDGIFHSGDQGRRLPDGNIAVTGRLNTMVKINGNRVEPGEIEAVMRRIPGVRDAAVRDFENSRKQTFLSAYYTGTEAPAEDEIRAALARELPAYMIPAFFTRMEALPLNRNGKVDRFSLPAPDLKEHTGPWVSPRTPEEKKLCAAFEKVLNAERIGLTDDFFTLGGDSVSAALLAAELEELNVDYRDITVCRTPGEIAARLKEKAAADLDALQQTALTRDQHPSPYQIYFYDAQLYAPLHTCENNFIALKFAPGTMDPLRLKAALETVFCRYSVFSAVFAFSDTGELVLRQKPGGWQRVEIRPVPVFDESVIDDFIQPFPLVDSLMYRCRIYTTPEQVVLALDTHHTISDGSTIANFMSELFAAYEGRPLREDHYWAWLEAMSRKRSALALEADTRLLFRQFDPSGFSCNPIPDQESRGMGNGRLFGSSVHSQADFEAGCRKLSASMNRLCVAAGMLALARCNSISRVSACWIYNGRDERWMNDLIGLTLSSIPVAADLAHFSSATSLLAEIDRQSTLGLRWSECSLGNSGVTPGEQDRLIIVYESGFDSFSALPPGTEMVDAYDRLNGTFTRCQILIWDNGDRKDLPLSWLVNYNTALYSRPYMERFSVLFREALDDLISGGDLHV